MSRVSLEVPLRPPCAVHVGAGVLADVVDLTALHEGCAVIADARAAPLHARRLVGLEPFPRLEVGPGEAAKDMAQLARALEFLAAAGLGRASLVVTLGGGAVSDLGGLAASLYMRGVAVAHCPTTLLAQVDAAIGGKTAVNLRAGKNLAGTFHQPRAVYADTGTLSSLADEDMRSGLGEVVKCALLGADGLLERLEEEAGAILARDPAVLTEVVAACARLKAHVVSADELDEGQRRSLNLGHTFAHAIEHAAGYGVIPHGVAVAAGLALALEASRRAGLLEDEGLPERVARLLGRLGLPASLEELRRSVGAGLAAEELMEAMRLDKKSRRAEPRLVLVRRAGAVEIDVPMDAALLRELLA